MTILLKTELSQPVGKPIKVIVAFDIEPADPSVGYMSEYVNIETILVINTKFYLEDIISDDVEQTLKAECLKYYEEEYKS